jgi:hypothetical protein
MCVNYLITSSPVDVYLERPLFLSSTRIDQPNNPLTAAFRGPAQEVNTQGQWLAGVHRKLMKMQCTAPAQLADELYTFNPQSNADAATRPLLSIDSARLDPRTGPLYPEGTTDGRSGDGRSGDASLLLTFLLTGMG